MDKKYIVKIFAVEDLDGTSDYLIGSNKPLPENLIAILNRDYIGISRLEYYSKLYGFDYEAIEEEE